MSITLKQPSESTQNEIRILIPEKNDRIQEAIKILENQSSYNIIREIPARDLGSCKNMISESIKKRNLTESEVSSYINHIAMQSSAALKLNYVDAVVIGSEVTTADVIRSGLWLGLKSTNLISSCFLMAHPKTKKVILYSDCGVNAEPNYEQLSEIAIQSTHTWKVLQKENPKVAFLSFSTKGSAQHPCVEKVKKATELFQSKNPDIESDGEMQFDAAWNESIKEHKAPNSPLNGRANCFIFPNLDSGNIAYKITQQLAGYDAFGPILQGFSKPLMDLSRGSTVQDIVYTAKIAGALSQKARDTEQQIKS